MAEEAAVRQRVRLGMGPEGGKVVGGAGSPGGEGVDVGRSVIAAESVPCEMFVGEGACWATAVAAAWASAEPVPPLETTAKTESKTLSAAGNNSPRPGRPSTVVKAADA